MTKMVECSWSERQAKDELIAIVGGGVSGLYCAWQLGLAGKQVVLLEASSDRFGGRMETVELDGFLAEFGPMRFEPTLQPRFAKMVAELGLEFVEFVGPSAEDIHFPKYDVLPSEMELDALQLLRRGIMLVMGREPGDQAWIDSLSEDDYRRIRRSQKLGGKYLWNLGFWNALSADGILSHQALMKIRDTGTFYHMIQENLNAIEWIIWWLRALKTVGQELATIKGGTGKITEQLFKRLHALPNVEIYSAHKLLSFSECDDKQSHLRLVFETRDGTKSATVSRLILALPKLPLKKLAASLPHNIEMQLDAVNGFAMSKVFYVTNSPWWERGQRPQQYANRMPTRELHYYRREAGRDDDGLGMVMLYTDTPATEYWRHYLVAPKNHDRSEIGKNIQLAEEFAKYIARDVKRALEFDHQDNTVQLNDNAKRMFADRSLGETARYIQNSIVSYGIRDWACEPYGAGNHGWQPGVQSWNVIDAFKAFSVGSGRKNVHICGEAYSDYQGFIEGALNSAYLVLDECLKHS
jgi:monoamine oxidase